MCVEAVGWQEVKCGLEEQVRRLRLWCLVLGSWCLTKTKMRRFRGCRERLGGLLSEVGHATRARCSGFQGDARVGQGWESHLFGKVRGLARVMRGQRLGCASCSGRGAPSRCRARRPTHEQMSGEGRATCCTDVAGGEGQF